MKVDYKSKTFWGGITGIVGAAAGFFTGMIGPQEAINIAFGSIMAIFLRDGISKVEKKVEPTLPK